MAQQLADRRDIDFVLWEQLNCEQFLNHELYRDFNKKTCDMIVTEARSLAIKEVLPTLAEGDQEAVEFDNGTVKVPESFHRVFKLILESEWNNLGVPVEMGGQGAPGFITSAALEYLLGANWPLVGYATMGNGTANMIQLYGTEEQKEKYVKQLTSAQWGGTMLLTEPEAGSDVGALSTTAVRNPDGTFTLTGNKIFITNGEHDLAENIIHPVLARIEGDPSGTRGISIFIVPKYFVNDDGSLGDRNDIVCTGVEHKHGLKASATCSMSLGSKGKCIGYLLGEECQIPHGRSLSGPDLLIGRLFAGCQLRPGAHPGPGSGEFCGSRCPVGTDHQASGCAPEPSVDEILCGGHAQLFLLSGRVRNQGAACGKFGRTRILRRCVQHADAGGEGLPGSEGP
jgi:hypothetical protein